MMHYENMYRTSTSNRLSNHAKFGETRTFPAQQCSETVSETIRIYNSNINHVAFTISQLRCSLAEY